MREYQYPVTTSSIIASTCLSALINRIIRDLAPGTVSGKTILVNEIEPGFCTAADTNSIIPIIDELLNTVLVNARNGQIYIQASRFRDIIVLEIEERNNYNGYALACRISNIEPLARMLGGCICIKGQQQLKTTISFSFPDEAGKPGYNC